MSSENAASVLEEMIAQDFANESQKPTVMVAMPAYNEELRIGDTAHPKTNITVLIPAFNEGLVIGSLVLEVLEYADTVVVINDGSSDKTEKIAKLAGATVISMPENGGKAKAMMAGFSYARKLGSVATVMMDGDGQHRPEDIPKVAAPVLTGVADLVVGSRFMDSADASEEGIQGYRKFGQKVLNTATNVSASVKCSDSQSGFRALSLRALEHCDFKSDGYGIESDMLAHFAECDLRITEVPITVAYDVPNMHKMNPVKHGLSVLSGIVQLFTVKHPLICFGVPGTVFVGVGLWLAIEAFAYMQSSGSWATTNTLGAAMLMMMGMLLWSVALILYSIAKIVKFK